MHAQLASDHQLEVFLADAAVRTRPRVRHFFPTRPRLDTVLRQALRFVIDESANHAHPGAVSDGGSS
jgi:hypothetical protein